MSISIELYVVDEARLSIDPSGTDHERYERLVREVRQVGAHWDDIESDGYGFALALEAIDAHIGGRKFLPIFAFNNSPSNVLGNDSDCPDFGYFRPEAASDLATLLSRVTDAELEQLSKEAEFYKDIYWKFRGAAEEAAKRGFAIAVLHDAPALKALQSKSR